MPFYVYKCIEKLLGQICGQGNQNWKFGVENSGFPLGENTRTGLLFCAIPTTETDVVPGKIAINSKPRFCCFGYLGADPNFIICFFQHV
jgi:hypothetical protein